MGAKGAAIATVSAQGFSFLFALVYLCKKGIGYSFYKEDICFSKYIQKIMQIGFPLGLQSVLVNISFLIITIIVNQMGLIASASLGVVEKLMGEHPEINLNVVPACTFTLPEVAQVGLTEEEVIAQNIPYVKSKFMFSGNGKAVSLGEADGFVKVLATEDLKRILGIHIIGPHANDLIHEGTVAMANDMGVESIGKMIHAHPTLSEAFMEAIHQLEGKSIHSAPAK